MLLLLIFIFIVIDFSENSDDFSDRGATAKEIWGDYYLHYIAEIVRLVSPVAIFVAALLITGQLADRVEIIALKSAGISLVRFLVPFIFVGVVAMFGVSYLDGFVVPHSNTIRVNFERMYINRKSDRIDKNKIFRQNSKESILQVNYFEPHGKMAYKVILYEYKSDTLVKQTEAARMKYVDSLQVWEMSDVQEKVFSADGFVETYYANKDTVLSVFPRDLARTTADIFQLNYFQISEYIDSIRRSGAGGIELPEVQFYSKLFYPFTIPIVLVIGVCIASVRRKGGKGAYLAIGLGVSFLYLVLMKLFEPLGINGVMSPLAATLTPHIGFFLVAVILLITAKK